MAAHSGIPRHNHLKKITKLQINFILAETAKFFCNQRKFPEIRNKRAPFIMHEFASALCVFSSKMMLHVFQAISYAEIYETLASQSHM